MAKIKPKNQKNIKIDIYGFAVTKYLDIKVKRNDSGGVDKELCYIIFITGGIQKGAQTYSATNTVWRFDDKQQ